MRLELTAFRQTSLRDDCSGRRGLISVWNLGSKSNPLLSFGSSFARVLSISRRKRFRVESGLSRIDAGALIMVTTVRLTVQTGPHKGKKFCFCGATRCLIGRAPDCFVQMAGAVRDQTISRHHCELAIDPTSIRIQDLGSQNGTYINGKPVEATELALMESTEATGGVRIGQMVQSGDLLTIGGHHLASRYRRMSPQSQGWQPPHDLGRRRNRQERLPHRVLREVKMPILLVHDGPLRWKHRRLHGPNRRRQSLRASAARPVAGHGT